MPVQRVGGARAVPLGRGEEVLGRVQLPVSLQREGEGVLEGVLLRLRDDLRVSMNYMGFTILVPLASTVNHLLCNA